MWKVFQAKCNCIKVCVKIWNTDVKFYISSWMLFIKCENISSFTPAWMLAMIFGLATSHCSLAVPLTLTKFSLYVPGKNRTTQKKKKKKVPVDTLTFGAGRNQSSVIFHRGTVCLLQGGQLTAQLVLAWLSEWSNNQSRPPVWIKHTIACVICASRRAVLCHCSRRAH